jgi:uncharacterized protein (TIGR01370 family)
MELFSRFERVIVEADNLDNLEQAQAGGAEIFAYVSVGEAEGWRASHRELNQHWVLGKNQGWGSKIIDLTQPGWREYLLEKRMAPLWAEGYRGFFLDTLDSYQAAVTDAPGRAAQARALVNLVHAMKQRFRGVKLILNRGFEILPEVSDLIVGVVAESLFCGWDPIKQRYVSVPEQDRLWLLGRLREVRDRYHLPVTVVDYLPPEQRDLARQTARRIAELGFIPWIANVSLDIMGVGAVEVVP